MHTQVTPCNAFESKISRSTHTLNPRSSDSTLLSNQSPQRLRSSPLKNRAGLRSSTRPLLRRTVLAPLLPPALFLDDTLRFSPGLRGGFDLVFGATITSASGDSFANGELGGGAGTREVTMIFAVEVGEKWRVSGCVGCVDPVEGA